MRTVGEVTGKNFLDIIDTADCVLTIGEKGTRSYNSYLKYGKKVLNFTPAVSPDVAHDDSWDVTRSQKEFLCFAGNGLICKGVDVVTEAFLRMPDKTLHICGPMESSYEKVYMPKIHSASNIKYHGFIEPGKEKFNSLASKCAFVIFHSSAESCCTSVSTAMRAGLVPVINPWTSIDVSGCGIELSDDGDLIENVVKGAEEASSLDRDRYKSLVHATLSKTEKFTQQGFTESYSSAVDEMIGML
jgi:glycosyltransferase involved in cell wall biosynthesis